MHTHQQFCYHGCSRKPNGTSANLSSLPHTGPWNLVPTTLRDVGTISTPDTQHSSVTIPASRLDPSRSVQSPATRVESIWDALCSRGFSIDVASRVSRPQRKSTLAIYETKWRIFTAWCNIQHINPLLASESVVYDPWLHHSHSTDRPPWNKFCELVPGTVITPSLTLSRGPISLFCRSHPTSTVVAAESILHPTGDH